MLDMTAKMIWPREALSANGADIWLVHTTIMRADVVCHAVLSLKTLVADGALKGLLVRVRKLVAVEMVDVTEGLTAHIAAMVLLHRLGGLLGHWRLLRQGRHHARSSGCRGGCRGKDACHRGYVRGVGVVITWHSGDERHHGGRCGCLLGP